MKKLLTSVLAVAMGATLAFGAGCTPDEGGQNGNDAEIAQKAITTIKGLYSGDDKVEPAGNYTVMGQVSVENGQYMVDVNWTVSSESTTYNINDYVSISETMNDEKEKTVTVTKAAEAIDYTLTASVTVGTATEKADFARRVPAKPKDAAGTKEDPYSPGKVIEIASALGDPGTYYYSEADKAAKAEVPTRVWVKGCIVDTGNGTYTDEAAMWLYIADSYDSSKTYDKTNSLCLYRVEYDDENLVTFSDLALGKEIMVNGHIEWYKGTKDAEAYAEIASFKMKDGSYSSVYCDYLEKEAKSDLDYANLALKAAPTSLTVTKAEPFTLPTPTLKGATYEWEGTADYPVVDGKLQVTALPAAETTITITVKATYGTATTEAKDVKVTIKAAADLAENAEMFDFAGETAATSSTSELSAEACLELLQRSTSRNSATRIESTTPTKVYNGAGSGGAHNNEYGMLKLGTGSANGGLTLKFTSTVTKIVINCHDFYALGSTNPKNHNFISVNGSTPVLLPYNEAATGVDMEFELTEPSDTVTISITNDEGTKGRAYIFSFTVYYSENFAPRTPQDNVADAKAAVDKLLTKNYNATGEYPLPASSNGASFSWELVTDTQLVEVTDNGLTLNVVSLPDQDQTITLKVTITCDPASDTLELEITLSPAPSLDDYGTEQTPLSVTEALALAAKECPNTNDWTAYEAYVVGVAKTTPGLSSNQQYYTTFMLVDKEDTSKEITVYSINLNPGVDQIAQNDLVVVRGFITCFGSNKLIEISGDNKTSHAYPYALKNTRGESTVTLGEHTGATVEGLPDEKKVNGTEVTFTVTAEANKQIVSVNVNSERVMPTEDSGNTYKFTVLGNMTVTVETADQGAALPELNTTITFGSSGDVTSTSKSKVEYVKNGFTFTNNKGDSNTDCRFSDTDHYRIYANSNFTLHSETAFCKLVFTTNSDNKYVTALEKSIKAWTAPEDVTVTVTADSNGKKVTVEFSKPVTDLGPVKMTAQAQVKSLDIYTLSN